VRSAGSEALAGIGR